jgi:hypothetical protein
MIRIPTLLELQLTIDTNKDDPDDLGQTIKHLIKINPTSTELRLTQCHLELALVVIIAMNKYEIQNTQNVRIC